MKKVFFILAMAFAAVTVMTSCSDKKVTKESFIGTWEVTSIQEKPTSGTEWRDVVNGGMTLTVKADGTCLIQYSDGSSENSPWAYDESTNKLLILFQYWTVQKCSKKEIQLYCDEFADTYLAEVQRATLKRVK